MRSEARDTKHTILKVLVGSQAHGLAGPESDADYRSVFVVPTAEMFRVGYRYQGARMIKSVADESAWEIGLFLSLAAECQPLILETFLAPVVTMDHWGEELRSLFPSVWSPQRAYESFVGYALNQRKKFLEKKMDGLQNMPPPLYVSCTTCVSSWRPAVSPFGLPTRRSARPLQTSKTPPSAQVK